jgi:hypothetical protein
VLLQGLITWPPDDVVALVILVIIVILQGAWDIIQLGHALLQREGQRAKHQHFSTLTLVVIVIILGCLLPPTCVAPLPPSL